MLEVKFGFTEFKLNYSATKNTVVGHCFSSDKFTAGGHNWRVYCYPRGSRNKAANNGEYLSLFFRLLGHSRKVKAIIEAFVVGGNAEPSSEHQCRRKIDFTPRYATGWSAFAKLSDLESECDADGWITFMCGVIVLRENSILDNHIPVPSSDIQSDLGNLLESADGTDVSFCVNGEMFHAHRSVLLGPMAEAKMPCITLHDIEPAAFGVLLQFIYTDTLPGDDSLGGSSTDMFQHLLAAGDRYALNRLKLICAHKLWENMSVDVVVSALTCAEIYNCPELRSRYIDFMAEENNFKKVVLTEGFMQLGQRFPSVIAELKQRVGA